MITLESLSKGQQTRAPRMVILGVEKIGKTSFACGCHFDETGALAETGLNAPVVIPCKGEEGADGIGVTTFPTPTSACVNSSTTCTCCSWYSPSTSALGLAWAWAFSSGG